MQDLGDMNSKTICLMMALVSTAVLSAPVSLLVSTTVSTDRVGQPVVNTATRTTNTESDITTTVKDTTLADDRALKVPRSNSLHKMNSVQVRTPSLGADDAGRSLLLGSTKRLSDKAKTASTKHFDQSKLESTRVMGRATSHELGRTSAEISESEKTASPLITTHEGQAAEIPSGSYSVQPVRAQSSTADTEQPVTSDENTERTIGKTELEQTPEPNTGQDGLTTEGEDDVFHPTSGSKYHLVTIMSSSRSGGSLQPVASVVTETPKSEPIPNLNTLLQTATNVKHILENLEVFTARNLKEMCEMDKMPRLFGNGCVKDVANLPSFRDNMAKINTAKTPEETIYAELLEGVLVFKRYEKLLNIAQIRLCSVFVGHQCPITCDVMADYSSFSHLEKKVCSLQGAKLLLNGAINVLTGVVNPVSTSTQNPKTRADDSIWYQVYPELEILTGLTNVIKQFINILRKKPTDK